MLVYNKITDYSDRKCEIKFYRDDSCGANDDNVDVCFLRFGVVL